MRDQDVITRLVELHDHIYTPPTQAGEDALRGKRLARRRRTESVAMVAAAVVLVAGLVQVSWPDEPSELQPAPAPSSPIQSDSAEPVKRDDDSFATEFSAIVAQVPDWTIADVQERFGSDPCAGRWSSAAGGFSGGNFDVRTNGELGQVWHDVIGFPSAARASTAVDRLTSNLASCTTTAWQTTSIAPSGAVLASSAQGLMWIQQNGEEVSTLNAVTNDGPPPLAIQVEIADLMRSYFERRHQ
jgi:hypothetical protein